MQAIILAAGMGKRLKELTRDHTKCMVKVNGITLIERMLTQLNDLNLSAIVIVVGYHQKTLIDFLDTLKIQTPITYIHNKIYDQTNNIYSLYLAREYLLSEDTILLESDLIFEDAVLKRIVDNPFPNLALVAKYESWMDGTVVTLDQENRIESFLGKKEFTFSDIESYYKTVNIYKFSQEFSNMHYVPSLIAYSKVHGRNEYYEQVLKGITLLNKKVIQAESLNSESWYEIDDAQDLSIAESIFTTCPGDKLKKFQNKYGGYWRYPDLIDFCYLVNPYFPPKKLLDEIKANFETLITSYPSGMEIHSQLAANQFGLAEDQILVGNGAAELIKALMDHLSGKFGMVLPTFEEYPNRIKASDLIAYYPNNKNYAYTAEELIKFYSNKPISNLLLINPDNPSGNYVRKPDVLKIAEWSKKKGITLIVDESFVDFVDIEESVSLLDRVTLKTYPNLIVIKSLSKSFGIPGLRLGILASYQGQLLNDLKKNVAIWNINSFAEFYMQIFQKYRSDYDSAIEKFHVVKKEYIKKLTGISNLRVIPSQANYLLCELTGGYHSKEVTAHLLDKYQLLIKDLSTKKGFTHGQYIRIAIKQSHENNRLVEALNQVLQEDKKEATIDQLSKIDRCVSRYRRI